ncbi:hypothetical protein OOK27_47980 [Streptomyces canus]|uniref:hypothetical protein n=1 Tax=Streptomyces canus TaxID=58343 RepID=UPI00225411FB|nr:hypothetical protein [Streptomyces canus]MCX5261783.1 hypothetical protein [Streptomyces canus]
MTTPNYPLALAIATAGWSNHETARLINERAQRDGYRGVAIDHSRVGRWIRFGEKPRPPVPDLLAELLSERLGQHCTPELLRLTPGRRVHVFLDAAEHEALVAVATAANVPVEEYVRELLRSALARLPARPH